MRSTWLLRWAPARDPQPEFRDSDDRDAGPVASAPSRSPEVLLDGHVSDQPALMGELGLAPEVGVNDILSVGYKRWGEGLLEKLRGAYALAIWDPTDKQLTIARDALGLHPCSYWWDGDLLVASPSLEQILAEPGVVASIHRVGLAEYLIGRMPRQLTRETFFEGVLRIAPAHFLTVTVDGFEESCYWNPLPRGFEWAGDDELKRFPQLLDRAVGRCLEAGADSLALSGGFDSVSIAGVASNLLRGTRRLGAVSLHFAGSPNDESDTQIAVARSLGMPQIIRTIDESLGGRNPVEAALEFSAPSPVPVLSVWQSMYTGLLELARSRGYRSMLMGTGGDDLLNVDLSYGFDCLERFQLADLWRFYRTWVRTSQFSSGVVAREVLWRRALLPYLRRGGSSLLESLAPATRDSLRRKRWRRSIPRNLLPGDPHLLEEMEERRFSARGLPKVPTPRSEYVQVLRSLLQAPLLILELDQGFAWAEAHGFRLLYPYFDRDLVELTLRIRPEHLIAGGWAKAPVRELVADLLPDVEMRKKKVDFTGRVKEILRPAGKLLWREMRESLRIVETGLVCSEPVLREMDDFLEGRSESWSYAWRVMSTESWIRGHTGVTRNG